MCSLLGYPCGGCSTVYYYYSQLNKVMSCLLVSVVVINLVDALMYFN